MIDRERCFLDWPEEKQQTAQPLASSPRMQFLILSARLIHIFPLMLVITQLRTGTHTHTHTYTAMLSGWGEQHTCRQKAMNEEACHEKKGGI